MLYKSGWKESPGLEPVVVCGEKRSELIVRETVWKECPVVLVLWSQQVVERMVVKLTVAIPRGMSQRQTGAHCKYEGFGTRE